jgi:hypothetical protein
MTIIQNQNPPPQVVAPAAVLPAVHQQPRGGFAAFANDGNVGVVPLQVVGVVSNATMLERELAKYIATPKFAMFAPSQELNDLLGWWKVNAASFPLIVKLAMKYLGLPAT